MFGVAGRSRVLLRGGGGERVLVCGVVKRQYIVLDVELEVGARLLVARLADSSCPFVTFVAPISRQLGFGARVDHRIQKRLVLWHEVCDSFVVDSDVPVVVVVPGQAAIKHNHFVVEVFLRDVLFRQRQRHHAGSSTRRLDRAHNPEEATRIAPHGLHLQVGRQPSLAFSSLPVLCCYLPPLFTAVHVVVLQVGAREEHHLVLEVLEPAAVRSESVEPARAVGVLNHRFVLVVLFVPVAPLLSLLDLGSSDGLLFFKIVDRHRDRRLAHHVLEGLFRVASHGVDGGGLLLVPPTLQHHPSSGGGVGSTHVRARKHLFIDVLGFGWFLCRA
mmetsp:Transcript_83907/g.168036  ORF Transcript_83907/g.168036 Transcript_83907/m.168036 type:complete len:330 (-) Transcript_83907:687-1676(-)